MNFWKVSNENTPTKILIDCNQNESGCMLLTIKSFRGVPQPRNFDGSDKIVERTHKKNFCPWRSQISPKIRHFSAGVGQKTRLADILVHKFWINFTKNIFRRIFKLMHRNKNNVYVTPMRHMEIEFRGFFCAL